MGRQRDALQGAPIFAGKNPFSWLLFLVLRLGQRILFRQLTLQFKRRRVVKRRRVECQPGHLPDSAPVRPPDPCKDGYGYGASELNTGLLHSEGKDTGGTQNLGHIMEGYHGVDRICRDHWSPHLSP